MAPSFYFALTQPINSVGKIVILLFPLGLFMSLFSLFKNTGISLLLAFPFLFLHAFQIVLFYLYGEDVIAVDMFLNVASTNSSEIGELLGSLLPSISLVLVLYVPVLLFATLQIIKRNSLDYSFRKRAFLSGIGLLVLPLLFSNASNHNVKETFDFSHEVYPVSALKNLAFAIDKWNKVQHYPESSKDFTFQATRDSTLAKERQIYVLVIGETARADNWSLYGYERETNPRLKEKDDIIVFNDALTQSNTTHKSVSMLLSDVNIEDYNSIYKRKGIMQAFKEAGFTTIALSNQAENASFIDYFTKDAAIYKTLRVTDRKTGITENRFDADLVAMMQEEIDNNAGDLFILLHTYGSHFKYMERYPEQFRKFTPDQIKNVSKSEREILLNAYDNTILYTDYFLSETINALAKVSATTALLYTSDHGEDLLDDARNKFLHASPTPTYYQLRVPFILWFSESYNDKYPQGVAIVKSNKANPISSSVVFHTMLDIARIRSPFLDGTRSLINDKFQIRPRLYLNDHDIAVPYLKMNLKQEDFDMLKRNNIKE